MVAPNRWGTRIAETQHSPNFFKSWGTSNAEPNNPPFFSSCGATSVAEAALLASMAFLSLPFYLERRDGTKAVFDVRGDLCGQ